MGNFSKMGVLGGRRNLLFLGFGTRMDNRASHGSYS